MRAKKGSLLSETNERLAEKAAGHRRAVFMTPDNFEQQNKSQRH
jgi:hypothetical protein